MANTGKRTVVDGNNAAFYLHVDDGVFLGVGDLKTNFLMHATADGLEEPGFTVKERNNSGFLEKVIGYEVVRSPPGLRYPRDKANSLRESMLWLCSLPRVQVDVVWSILGV